MDGSTTAHDARINGKRKDSTAHGRHKRHHCQPLCKTVSEKIPSRACLSQLHLTPPAPPKANAYTQNPSDIVSPSSVYLEPAVASHMHPIVRAPRVVRQNPESKHADSSHPRPPRRIFGSVPRAASDMLPFGGIGVSLVAANTAVCWPLVGCRNTLSLAGKATTRLGLLLEGTTNGCDLSAACAVRLDNNETCTVYEATSGQSSSLRYSDAFGVPEYARNYAPNCRYV